MATQVRLCFAGGTFALYARLARSCKLPTPIATEQEFDTNLMRYGTKLEKGARPSLGTYVSTLVSLSCGALVTLMAPLHYRHQIICISVTAALVASTMLVSGAVHLRHLPSSGAAECLRCEG